MKSRNKNFHHKGPISIKNIDINEIVVSRSLLVKKIFNILLVTKMLNKLNLYIYFSQKMSAYIKDFDETK